jgi:hypothetical protein
MNFIHKIIILIINQAHDERKVSIARERQQRP